MHGIHTRLCQLRRKHPRTYQALSTATGLAAPHLSNLEKGRREQMTVDTLTRLAHVYNVSTDYLLGLAQRPGVHRCTAVCPLFAQNDAATVDP